MTDTQSDGIGVRTERLKRRLDEIEHLRPVPDELDELFEELGAKADDLRRLMHERDVRLGRHLRDASAEGETAARRDRIRAMRAEMNEALERSESKERPALHLVRGDQA